jgi:hypothetical protein
VGGKIITNEDSLDEFFGAVAAADKEYFDRPALSNITVKPIRSSEHEQRIQEAERTLEKAGI